MSNTINWGKISETTWFGDKQNTAKILENSGTTDFNSVFDFESQVVSDSGTHNNSYCLHNLVLKLELL